MNELDCKDIKALLSGLIDDELDPHTRHQAERHLTDCRPCRDAVTEAEGLSNLLALEAQRQLWPVGLPAGFENVVLRQTVYAEAYQYAGRRWTSWLGWVAAAACLGLACSLWFLMPSVNSSTSIATRTSPIDATSRPQVWSSAYGTNLTSWIYDGGLPAAALSQHESRLIDEQLANVIPASYAQVDVPDEVQAVPITRDDAQTIYAASNLLDMLQHADLQTFADVDRIRQIAEYDGILDRLADSRERLSAADRPAVMAAESVLLRVVNGPMSLDDLRLLNNTVAALDLPAQMETISNRERLESSL